MADFPIGVQTDPLLLKRHNRLKLTVALVIAALCLSAVLLLAFSTGLHDHLRMLPFATALAIAIAMWCLMSVAMMLPTAWHMVATYLDIKFAAGMKGMAVPSVGVLVLGYLTVWALFSIAAAAAQTALFANHLIGHDGGAPWLFSGFLFLAAGSFEFTTLKSQCLTQCRNPFNTMLSQFRPSAVRIYRIGVEQGLYCLGCCWALMLLMFASGLMNLGWMALLAALMAIQKHRLIPRFERLLGFGLVTTGLALIGFSVA